jgi:acyl-CoA thioester hydrolase
MSTATRESVTSLRVRYAETDQMGVAYYANYLVWFEVARTDWLRQAGSNYRQMEEAGVFLPVIEAHCEYHQPARYDDALTVRTRATRLSPVRLRFDYTVLREAVPRAATIVLASGHTMHAAVDRSGRPCRLPPDVRALLEPIAPGPAATGRRRTDRPR